MKLARQSQLYAVYVMYVMYIYTSLTNSIMVRALIHSPCNSLSYHDSLPFVTRARFTLQV